MSRLTVAGIGPGEADYILPAVIKKMKKAHTVIAAKRILPVLKELCQDVNSEADSENNKPVFLAMGKIKDTLEQIGEILSKGQDVVMAVSGDPLMYSLYRTICNDPISEGWEVDLIPGVGSLQMLGAAFGETMEEALIISVHGRILKYFSFAVRNRDRHGSHRSCSTIIWIMLPSVPAQIFLMKTNYLSQAHLKRWYKKNFHLFA